MTMTTLSLFDDPPVEDEQPRAAEPTRSDSGPDTLLTPVEAAAMLRIGRSKLYELIARGRIESVKLGRCRRFRRTDLDRFIRTLADEPAD